MHTLELEDYVRYEEKMESKLRKLLPQGRFTDVPEARRRAMGRVAGRNNATTEVRFRLGLVRRGISGWTLHAKVLRACPDFYFAAHRLAIFVDGCFWHGCPHCGHLPRTHSAFWRAKIEGTRTRDRRHSAELRQQGIRVVRFWEHDLEANLGSCLSRICRMIRHSEAS